MHEIERVLRRAGRRLLVVDLLQTLTMTFTLGVAALIVALLLERALGLFIPWQETFAISAALLVVGALVWSVVRRARGLALAREVDERAGLRESLSTAMCVASADDPWSKAVVETARQRALRVVVRDAVPIESPRLLPVPLCSLLAFGLLWMVMPSLDLTGREQAIAEIEQNDAEIMAARHEVANIEKDLQKLLEKANVDLDAIEADEPENPEASADEVLRTAIKKLTNLEQQLKQEQQSESAKQAEATRQMMRRLKTPGPGPLDEMAKALAQGKFDEAKKALEELAAKLESGELSDSEREAASEQLKNLSGQLEKLAQQQDKLENMLKEAGMSAEQAKNALSDPGQMQKAMESLDNLTPEQKEALINQVQGLKTASSKCEGLSDELSKMGMACGQGEAGEMMDGAMVSGAMLSEMEMLEGELSALEASLGQCNGAMCKLAGQCNSPGQGKWGEFSGWKEGDTSKLGNGSGGPGQGNGPGTDDIAADYTIKQDKANTIRKSGPITGQRWVYGNQVRGESKEAFRQAAQSASDSAAEALETMQVEPELRDAVQNYFGGLDAEGEADDT